MQGPTGLSCSNPVIDFFPFPICLLLLTRLVLSSTSLQLCCKSLFPWEYLGVSAVETIITRRWSIWLISSRSLQGSKAEWQMPISTFGLLDQQANMVKLIHHLVTNFLCSLRSLPIKKKINCNHYASLSSDCRHMINRFLSLSSAPDVFFFNLYIFWGCCGFQSKLREKKMYYKYA